MKVVDLCPSSVLPLWGYRNYGKHSEFKLQENWLQVWNLQLTSYETLGKSVLVSQASYPCGDNICSATLQDDYAGHES